jgi:hypothetical protein
MRILSLFESVETKARTLCACHPAANMSSVKVAPPARFIMSTIFATLVTFGAGVDLASGLKLAGAICFEQSVFLLSWLIG